jgi:methionine biosynthesis protein MetW
MAEKVFQTPRLGHKLIFDIIEPDSTVLDLGCGNGELLAMLKEKKNVRGQGIDSNQEAIFHCVEKGLSVFQVDFDSGLASYPDDSFDYVVLNQSLQEALHVEYAFAESLRVGRKVIIGFPNFANIRSRSQLFFKGRTPLTDALPYSWHNTPNLHFLSILDFKRFATERNITVHEQFYFSTKSTVRFWPNLFAVNAIFVISR